MTSSAAATGATRGSIPSVFCYVTGPSSQERRSQAASSDRNALASPRAACAEGNVRLSHKPDRWPPRYFAASSALSASSSSIASTRAAPGSPDRLAKTSVPARPNATVSVLP